MNGRGIEYNEGVSQSVITNILDAVKRFHSSRRQALAQPTSSSVKQAQPVDALFPIPMTTPDHSHALLTGVNSYSFQQHNCKTSTAQPSLIGDYYFQKSQRITKLACCTLIGAGGVGIVVGIFLGVDMAPENTP